MSNVHVCEYNIIKYLFKHFKNSEEVNATIFSIQAKYAEALDPGLRLHLQIDKETETDADLSFRWVFRSVIPQNLYPVGFD